MNPTLREIREDVSVCLCVNAACIYLLCLDSQKIKKEREEKEKEKKLLPVIYFSPRGNLKKQTNKQKEVKGTNSSTLISQDTPATLH